MRNSKEKETKRFYRHQRIRSKISGTAQKPRVCLHRSLMNLYVQAIDDTAGKVLFGVSTLNKDVRGQAKGANIKAATILGTYFAQEAQKKGIKKICFDRGGYLYHGRIKAFADAARQAGMEF